MPDLPPTPGAFQLGEWLVEPEIRQMSRGDDVRRLEPKVLDVLLMLVENAGLPVEREDLERSVWSGAAVGTDLLNRTIWKLRRELGDDPDRPRYVETIPRVGYRLVANVRPPSPNPGAAPATPTERTATSRMRWSRVALVVVLAALAGWSMWGRPRQLPTTPPPEVRTVPFTSDPGYESSPALSPDGRRVAYQRYDKAVAAPTWDIVLAPVGGGGATLLAGTPADELGPAWSPGGDSIAYVAYDGAGCSFLARGLDGGPPIEVSACDPDQSHEIVWASDETFIVASAGVGQTLGLYRLHRADGRREPLTSPPVGYLGDRRPHLSPDRRRVAFIRERTSGIMDLYVMDLTSGREARITSDHRGIGGLAWAAGGDALLFSSSRGGNSQVWRVPAQGGEPRGVPVTGRNISRLTPAVDGRWLYEEYDGDSDIWRLGLDGGTGRWGGSTRTEWGAAVTPDGRRLAFLSDRTGSAEVWVAEIDGSHERRLTHMAGAVMDPPRWSPDGRALVFAAERNGSYDVFRVDATGGTPRPLTDDPGDDRFPTWWGDDIVFTANRTGVDELWSLDAGRGPARRLTHGGGAYARAGADGRLYHLRPTEPGLWLLEADGRSQRLWGGLDPRDRTTWLVNESGLVYLRAWGMSRPRLELVDLATGTVDVVAEIDAEIPGDAGLVQVDAGTFLYSRIVRSESDLWIVTPAGR